MKIYVFTESIQCRLEKLSNPPFYLATIGYYRTAVGYYRVIAQKVLKSKSPHQDLLKKTKKKLQSIQSVEILEIFPPPLRNFPPCFATSGPKARRKFWGILMQNPLEIVVFQWKIAQERVRNT